MTEQQSKNEVSGQPLKGLQQDLKAAELYMQQGLLDEARNIYTSLRSRFSKYLGDMDQRQSLRPSVRNRLLRGLNILEVKLREINQKEAAFLDSAGGPVKKIYPNLTVDHIIHRGILLRELGFFDDAIEEFRQAASQDAQRVSECYTHMGIAIAEKGDVEPAVDMLRRVMALEAHDRSKQFEILEKIAKIYEDAGETQKAVAAYRELIFLDQNCGNALLKIEDLSAELKRSTLNFALVCRYPKVFFAASLILAIVFISFNPFVKIVNNVDYFTLEQNPDIQFYDNFKTIFGNDEFFIIAMQCPNLFSVNYLDMLQRITEEIEALPEVEDVTSLANVNDIVGGEDYFEVRKFLEEIPEDADHLTALKQNAVNNPLYLKNLISEDGKTAAIVVMPYDDPADQDFRKRILAQTRDILKPFETESVQFHTGGWTVTNYSLSKYLNADMIIFIPATYLLIMLSTWLFFRNWRLTLLAVINISLCVGATRGLMGMAGVTMNNVTSIIIPLIMALALCDTVHIFSHMDRGLLTRFSDETQALTHVLGQVALPCFLTTLTTAIGFLTLYVSEIPPIKQFAWIASAGMVFEFLFSFFLLPPLILFFNPANLYQTYEEGGNKMNGLLQAMSRNVRRYGRLILVASAVIVVGASVESAGLKVETNLIEFFKKSSPVRTSLDFIESHLAGVGAVDVSFEAKRQDAFKEPANLRIIETVQQFVSKLDEVDKTISFVDFLKDMNQSFHGEDPVYYTIPQSSDLISQYMLLYDAEDLEDYVNGMYDHARLSARISTHGSQAQKRLIQRINTYLGQIDCGDLVVRVTGRAVKDVNVVEALVYSQVYSLALAALVISIIMFIVFRSASLAALSMIPNIFPILLNFGIMGWLGIPLDTGTALIAAVALGIAVDDTVHFLTEYQRRRAQGESISDTLDHVIVRKGRAIISSSLILTIGFSVMVLSRFIPVIHFGLLCAIIMVTAIIGDLVLLPAIVSLKKTHAKAAPEALNQERAGVLS